jgi:hypothetical protein
MGDEEQGDAEWLKPDEFVARYKESTYYAEAEKTIEEIRSEASASQPSGKKEVTRHSHDRTRTTAHARKHSHIFDIPSASGHWRSDEGGLHGKHQVPHIRVVPVLAPHPALLHQALARCVPLLPNKNPCLSLTIVCVLCACRVV